MASTEEQTSCNREPFLSDEECNRGNVDIHQFDDLPYCDTINPTDPAIPPEIVDTPLNIPIPPPCACINVDSKYSAGWSRGWKTEGYFKSIGDCCDGNYESKFSLSIDCPIDFTGSRTISVNAKYGNGGGDSVPYITGSFCSVVAKDADLNIEIPCPVKSTKGSIGIGIGYGKGEGYRKYDFIKGNTKECTIEALNPEFNLQIPCPVIGASKGKITIGIGYGDGDSRATKTFFQSNAQACSIEALSPEINLNIPCPIKQTGSLTLSVGFASPAASLKSVKNVYNNLTDEIKWLYVNGSLSQWDQAIQVRSCVSSVESKLKTLLDNCDDEEEGSLIAAAEASVGRLSSAIESRYATSIVRAYGESVISIANGIIAKIKEKDEDETKSFTAPLFGPSSNSGSCELQPYDSELNLTIDCPFPYKKKCKKDGEEEEKEGTDVEIKYKKKIEEDDRKAELVKIDDENCKLSQAERVDLVIQCPFKDFRDKDTKTKIKFTLTDQTPDNEVDLVKIEDGEGDGPCELSPVESIDLEIPCPKIDIKSPTGGGISIREEGDGCNKTFWLTNSGGGGGGGGDFCAVTGLEIDVSPGHPNGGIKGTLKKKNVSTGEDCTDGSVSFTGNVDIKWQTVVTDVKYENNKFWKKTMQVLVLAINNQGGEPEGTWEEDPVFDTTPLSDEL